MATYDTYNDGSPIVRSGGSNAAGFPKVTVFENVYDASRRAATAADVIELLKIPAGSMVHAVYIKVLEGEAAQTVDVGDGDDPDGYFAAADVSTTDTMLATALALTDGTPNTVTGYSGGKFYAAEDTIDLVVPAGKDFQTLRIKVLATVTCVG